MAVGLELGRGVGACRQVDSAQFTAKYKELLLALCFWTSEHRHVRRRSEIRANQGPLCSDIPSAQPALALAFQSQTLPYDWLTGQSQHTAPTWAPSSLQGWADSACTQLHLQRGCQRRQL